MRPILAATTDSPYITTLLVGAISFLFTVVGKVGLELLKRSDKAHAEIVAQYEQRILDVVAQWKERLEESERRGDEWRDLARAEHSVTKDAVDVAKKV